MKEQRVHAYLLSLDIRVDILLFLHEDLLRAPLKCGFTLVDDSGDDKADSGDHQHHREDHHLVFIINSLPQCRYWALRV